MLSKDIQDGFPFLRTPVVPVRIYVCAFLLLRSISEIVPLLAWRWK